MSLETPAKTLAENLKKMREFRGMSQTALAAAAGVSPSMIVRIEQLKLWPRPAVAQLRRQLAKNHSTCRRKVSSACSNMNTFNRKLVMTYETSSCSLRHVTRLDIARDLKRWRRVGVEEGAIARHSELLKDFDQCLAAQKAGSRSA